MQVYFLVIAVVTLSVVGGDRPKTDCEKHRDSAEKTGTIMVMIPKCDKDGNYEALQCYKDHSFCVCYTKDGKVISKPSSKINDCRCHLMAHEKANRGHDNPFVPKCAANGGFEKKQKWDHNNSCWCVDEEGKQQGKITSDCESLVCE